MTAKEASKQIGGWITKQSAVLFIAGGLVAAAAGAVFDHLPEGVDKGGLYTAAIGLLAWLSEKNHRKITQEDRQSLVPLVVAGLRSEIDQGKEDHEHCLGLHDEHRKANARQDKQLGEITGEAVKAGWKLGLGS